MSYGQFGNPLKINWPRVNAPRLCAALVASLGVLPLAACDGDGNPPVPPDRVEAMVIPAPDSCGKDGAPDREVCDDIFAQARKIHEELSSSQGYRTKAAFEIGTPICESRNVGGMEMFFPAMSGVLVEKREGGETLQPLYVQVDDATRKCREVAAVHEPMPAECAPSQVAGNTSASGGSHASYIFFHTSNGGYYGGNVPAGTSYNYVTQTGHTVAGYTPATAPFASPATVRTTMPKAIPVSTAAIKPVGHISGTMAAPRIVTAPTSQGFGAIARTGSSGMKWGGSGAKIGGGGVKISVGRVGGFSS